MNLESSFSHVTGVMNLESSFSWVRVIRSWVMESWNGLPSTILERVDRAVSVGYTNYWIGWISWNTAPCSPRAPHWNIVIIMRSGAWRTRGRATSCTPGKELSWLSSQSLMYPCTGAMKVAVRCYRPTSLITKHWTALRRYSTLIIEATATWFCHASPHVR